MIDYFLTASKNTLLQVILLFGVTGLITALLFLFQYMIGVVLSKTFGWGSVYLTGWIGVPVHELSHALLCVIFRHKIVEISLFKPDPYSGVLGYVSHNFNPKSYFQNVGNFFIGVAPLFVGSILLYIVYNTFFAAYSAAPVHMEFDLSHPIDSITNMISKIMNQVDQNAQMLKSAFTNPGIWTIILIYVMASISTHIAPSTTDLRNGLPGFALIVAALFIYNLIVGLIGYPTPDLHGLLTNYLAKLQGILTFGLTLTLYTFALVYAPLAIFHLIAYRKFLNPLY